jgi:hypothetical protein
MHPDNLWDLQYPYSSPPYPVSSQLEDNTLMVPNSEPLIEIHPDVSKLMISMLDQIEKDELDWIKNKISEPTGINVPKKYSPVILIDSPTQDPEKPPIQNSKTSEYDPLFPSMNTHNCRMCHKDFKSKGALRRHITSKHTDSVFECEECNKKFLRKDSVRRHYSSYHKTVPLPEHLIVSSTSNSVPPKMVKFNLKSKTMNPPPVSQFADKAAEATTSGPQNTTDNKNMTSDNNALINKLLETLQALQKNQNN